MEKGVDVMGKRKNKVENARASDAFSNSAARTGYGQNNLLQATEYPLTRLTRNSQLLNSLYRSNWLVQNIIDTIPDDLLRKWFVLKTKIPADKISRFDKIVQVTNLKETISQGLKWGRLYGGAAGLILIDGQDDMLAEPLDYDSIMPDSFKGLYILDRWSGISPGAELITDICNPDFGLPVHYDITDPLGVIIERVHHSRVIRFTGRRLPRIEMIAEQYWGISELENVYNEIVKHDNVSENIAMLTFKACIDVMSVENLGQLYSIGGSQQQKEFWARLQDQAILQSNFGIKVINQGETFEQRQYSFAGLNEVYEIFMMDVAGSTHMPVTKLFGRSPAGMNATGESDLVNYYDYLENLREVYFRPPLEKLLPIIAISAWGEIPDDLEIVFEPLRSPTPLERADIASKMSDTIIRAFQAEGFDQATMMKEFKTLTDITGLFGNISDDDIEARQGTWASDLQVMADPFAGLSAMPDDGLGMEVTNGGQETTGGHTGTSEADPNLSESRTGLN